MTGIPTVAIDGVPDPLPEGLHVLDVREGWIAGAALDVYDEEPLPADHPFRSTPGILATGHLGYVTTGNYRIYYSDAVEDVAAFLAGAPVRVLDPA